MKYKKIYKITSAIIVILAILAGVLYVFARKDEPSRITYGMSFNEPYVRELGLDSKKVLGALIDELGVRHFRLAAHWTLAEPERDQYDMLWLDAQIAQVRESGGTVILGIGRRLPRWPECHIPFWAKKLTWEEQKEEIREYMRMVVKRYKNESSIIYWQVENEPYLEVFANDFCGELDEAFLEEEIALVHELDPTRPVLVTDSGNLGTWHDAYRQGDAFGTSVYVHFWNPELGQFRTLLPAWFYRVKENIVSLFFGRKPTFLIELSLEPWLIEPIANVPIDVQYSRMDAKKFDEIIEYARDTRYENQYLWGGEWWYWLKEHDYPEMWEKGKYVFTQ